MYTKGEWGLSFNGTTETGHQKLSVVTDTKLIATIQPQVDDSNEANARLIAQAPRLYEALKEIVAEGTRCLDIIQQDRPMREIYHIDVVDRIARQAIAEVEKK